MTDGGAERWFAQAEDDLQVARLLQREERLDHAAFLLQQAVEKALKAALLAQDLGLPRTHDCYFLAEQAKAPANILDAADAVAPYYVRTRYPDTAPANLGSEDVSALTDAAEEVIAWTRTKL